MLTTTLTPAALATCYSVQDIKNIVAEAKMAAHKAAHKHEHDVMQGRWGACGFAWVKIYGIKGNTKIGRRLKEAGVGRSWSKAYEIWNPSGYPTQNVDTLLAGAEAAAKVLNKYGFEAYAGSRLD